jgi:hypothetical protein
VVRYKIAALSAGIASNFVATRPCVLATSSASTGSSVTLCGTNSRRAPVVALKPDEVLFGLAVEDDPQFGAVRVAF